MNAQKCKVKIIQDDLEVEIEMLVIPRVGDCVRVFAKDGAMLHGEVTEIRWGINETDDKYGVAIQLKDRW